MARVCSECGGALPSDAPASQKTCSTKCRSKRHRRLKRNKREFIAAGNEARRLPIPPELVDNDVIAEVVREEARPIVREALNERVMEAMQDLVNLTPTLVRNLEQDLQDADPVVRQKSQAIVARYTLGMAKDSDAGKDNTLEVNINVPRPSEGPGDLTFGPPPVADAEGLELRVCEDCDRELPLEAFEGDAPRCIECVSALRRQALQRFEGPGDGNG